MQTQFAQRNGERTHEEICELQQMTNVIRQQIGMTTLMACGARKYTCGWSSDGHPHLNMQVGDGKKGLYVRITLLPSDTYTVELFQALRNSTSVLKQIEEYEDVYCEQLSSTVYHMVNK